MIFNLIQENVNKRLKNIQSLMTSTLGILIPGIATFGLAVVTLAQAETPSKPQKLPVKPVAKMIYAQMTYYEKNGKFIEEVDDLHNYLENDLGVELPSDRDYYIRTTSQASYNYVIPMDNSPKPRVGALFIPPDGSNKLMKIICQNQDKGRERPEDPQLFTSVTDSRDMELRCGKDSFQNYTYD